MDYKNSKAPRNTVTRDINQLTEPVGNVYETVAIIAKRANQISVGIKRELDAKLSAKQVKLNLSTDAFGYLLKEGFTPEYGAREMDRVIAQRLKPLLMREILFGSLKNGGEITIGIKDGSLSIG